MGKMILIAQIMSPFILKGIDWGFRKYMSTKIPGMVHQGLLVPQGLLSISMFFFFIRCRGYKTFFHAQLN